MGAKAFRNAPAETSLSEKRDVIRAVWELGRLHTREAWLCWYPAIWGACVAAGTREVSLSVQSFTMVLFGIWASVTATHVTFCTFNDICDRNLDAHVERCKTRPLPAGLISFEGAIITFLAELPITWAITRVTLGEAAVISFIPVWVLSTIYPFMKRLIPFPQVVLGAVIGGAVFPGWVSITNHISWEDFEAALPLFFATASWVVYFDVFYATQDSADDAKIGVKSLAVLMGSHVRLLLGALGLVQVGFFAVTALRAHLSLIFWVLGLGVWAVNIPWHIKSLDIRDSKSGGRIFKANIKLGLYLTGVTLMELIFTRVYLGALARIGPQAIKR